MLINTFYDFELKNRTCPFFCPLSDSLGTSLLKEYSIVFVTGNSTLIHEQTIVIAPTCSSLSFSGKLNKRLTWAHLSYSPAPKKGCFLSTLVSYSILNKLILKQKHIESVYKKEKKYTISF